VLFTSLILLTGSLIGASTYVAYIPAGARITLKVALAVICLAAWLFTARKESLYKYKGITASFFALSIGILLTYFIGPIPLKLLGLKTINIKGVAAVKFFESLPIVICILGVHFATGGKTSDLYLSGGKLLPGLVSAVVGMAIFVGLGALQSIGSGLSWSRIVRVLPWILLFIFSNAFLEELWFRALFLQKLQPFIGSTAAILLTSVVFGVIHISSTYVMDILSFVGVTIGLGVIWSWLMIKTESIWPAVLIHAAADILVILGFLAG